MEFWLTRGQIWSLKWFVDFGRLFGLIFCTIEFSLVVLETSLMSWFCCLLMTLKFWINTVESNGRIINLNLFDVNVSCHTYINSMFPFKENLNIAKYLLTFKPSLSIMKEDTLPILSITFAVLYYPQEWHFLHLSGEVVVNLFTRYMS